MPRKRDGRVAEIAPTISEENDDVGCYLKNEIGKGGAHNHGNYPPNKLFPKLPSAKGG